MQPEQPTKNVLDVVRGEIRDFLYNSIEVVPGYNFNQYDTIKRIHLYINSRFEDQTEYQGRPKMFFNIVKNPRDVVAKFLNIDTKDIKVINTAGDTSPTKTLVAQKEVEQWMKENDIAQKLNDMSDTLADFGSVVLKKTKKGAEVVDMRRLFNDPTVDSLQKSRFVTIKHLFTISELLKKKDEGWDADTIDNIVRWKKNQLTMGNAGTSYQADGQVNIIRSTPYIEVYERFGEIEKGYFDDRKQWDDTLVRSLFIVVEPNAYTDVQATDGTTKKLYYGGVLFKSEWKGEYPFDECHYYKTPGRWLGVGVVESLFIPQERINELKNQKRISMEISTIHLFQTSSSTVVKNVLTDLINADVIVTDPNSPIEPIANEERNLSAFESEEQAAQASADRISFVTPQVAGDSVPTSTPATNAVIQQNNVVSVFNFKRQNFANFIRRFMRTLILPAILKDISKEHVLRFVGNYDEMSKLNQTIATSYANEEVKRRFPNIVTPEEYQQMIQANLKALAGKDEIFMDVIKNWYGDVELDMDILIDNEQQATDALANNTWQIIQALSANPQALQDPTIRTLIMDWAEKVGINPTKLESAQTMSQTTQQLPPQQMQQQQVGQGTGQPSSIVRSPQQAQAQLQ